MANGHLARWGLNLRTYTHKGTQHFEHVVM